MRGQGGFVDAAERETLDQKIEIPERDGAVGGNESDTDRKGQQHQLFVPQHRPEQGCGSGAKAGLHRLAPAGAVAPARVHNTNPIMV